MTLAPERRQRLERLKDLLIAHLEDATDALHRQLAPLDVPDDPLRTALTRETADILSFWDRCGSLACWRARRCRRKPKNCFADCAPLVPPAARAEAMAKLRSRTRKAQPFLTEEPTLRPARFNPQPSGIRKVKRVSAGDDATSISPPWARAISDAI
jgi:hypothetical protein